MALLMDKIWIIGPPGSGETTIALKLSKILNIKLLNLDDIYWEENWVKNTNFANEVIDKFTRDGSWVVDGFYDESAEMMYNKANIIFLLEVPYFLMILRLIYRSFFRITKKQVVCGNNYENIKFLFSRNGLFRFAHEQYFF